MAKGKNKMKPLTSLLLLPFFCLTFAAPGSSAESPGSDATTKLDSLSIVFTHGPGGPIREKGVFFANETVFIQVKVPKQIKTDEMSVFLCEAAIVSREKPEVKMAMPKPMPISVVSLKDDSLFIQLNAKIPVEFEKGLYDVGVAVVSIANNVEFTGKETIEVMPSTDFGIRSPAFLHGWGNAAWVPGSNIYCAGENIRLVFEYAGLKVNENNEVKSNTKVVLTDEKGASVCISEIGQSQPLMVQKLSAWEQNKNWTSQWHFSVSQPGEYTLKIEVTDLHAAKTDSVELPLKIFSSTK